jgi:hypothetical protein
LARNRHAGGWRRGPVSKSQGRGEGAEIRVLRVSVVALSGNTGKLDRVFRQIEVIPCIAILGDYG